MVSTLRASFAFAGLALAAFCTGTLSGCSSAPTDDVSTRGDSASSALSTSSYVASDAVTYADDHWDDGVGECAEFVTHSLRAGHLNIPVITYVPTLYTALAKVSYEEHSASDSANASLGDVVMFSDGSGSDFCDVDDTSDEANCGHVCLVTVAGSDASSIAVDCHNNAHHEIAVADLLGGEYSVYRVYHLSKAGSAAKPVAPANTEACRTDSDCNGGASGSDVVCAASEGYCIRGCHGDADCPGSETCHDTAPHWSCY